MQELNLQAIPNQQFSADLDGHRVDIAIRTGINTMLADVSVDDIILIQGVRLVAGAPILPYEYLSTWGNLVLYTQGDELPWWENFGTNQMIYFLTPTELAEINT